MYVNYFLAGIRGYIDLCTSILWRDTQRLLHDLWHYSIKCNFLYMHNIPFNNNIIIQWRKEKRQVLLVINTRRHKVMSPIEVAIITSRIFFIIGSISYMIFLILTLKENHLKREYSHYYFLMVFSAIVILTAKFNLFVPIV